MASRRLSKHQVAVNVDSWSIAHLVMSQIIDDPIDWVNAVMKRSEVPSEVYGLVSPNRFAFNRRLCLFLRSNNFSTLNEFSSHFLRNWVQDSHCADDSTVQSIFFVIPDYFLKTGVPPDAFFSGIYIWYKFLNQQHFRPYWDIQEGVGISVMRDYYPPHDLSLLEGFSVPLSAHAREFEDPKFVRDSRTNDVYIGGPLSLVNHACSKHSNCVLIVVDGVRLAADSYINAGRRVYMCYNSNEDELIRWRGFGCAVCFRCTQYI